MDKKVIDFITKNRVCVLAVVLSDGTPHTATLHYSEQPEPLRLYFSTTRSSKKFTAFKEAESTQASVVIGFSEEEWLTLQMNGEVRVVPAGRLTDVHQVHYQKHPDAEQYKDSPNTVFLEFTPTWWRYTDFNTDPETILTSG